MRRTTFSATVAVSLLAASSAKETSALDILLSLASGARPQASSRR